MMKITYNIGTVVVVSKLPDAPKMCVECVNLETVAPDYDGETQYGCVWFDKNNQLQRSWFYTSLLTPLD